MWEYPSNMTALSAAYRFSSEIRLPINVLSDRGRVVTFQFVDGISTYRSFWNGRAWQIETCL